MDAAEGPAGGLPRADQPAMGKAMSDPNADTVSAPHFADVLVALDEVMEILRDVSSRPSESIEEARELERLIVDTLEQLSQFEAWARDRLPELLAMLRSTLDKARTLA